METLPLTKKLFPDKHWLKFINENGALKHVDLSGCANNFSRATGYESTDGLRAVGWRYQKGNQICIELFNIGHMLLVTSAQPNPIQALGYLFTGKNPQKGHKEFLESFDKALEVGGWKVVDRAEVEA